MKVKGRHLKALVKELIRRTKGDESKFAFSQLDEAIHLTENYIYTKIYLIAKKIADYDEVGFHDTLINSIGRFLGYTDMKDFMAKVDNPVPPQLAGCVGVYKSYIRRNLESEIGTVFRSPVRIYIDNGLVKVELKGPRITYRGDVRLNNGIMFLPLQTLDEKSFYHIYRIGTAQSPKVLQGTFSGVSSNFDPIAGRAVLIRSEKEFTDLDNAELPIETLSKSKLQEERRVAEYFKEFSKNNLYINKVYTFDLPDLGTCK